MLETADKKPTHHLSKGLVIGLVNISRKPRHFSDGI